MLRGLVAVIVIIVFECLSRLEFQLLGLSIQVTRAYALVSPGVAMPKTFAVGIESECSWENVCSSSSF